MQNSLLDFMMSLNFLFPVIKMLSPIFIWLAVFFIAVAVGVFRHPVLAPWKLAVFIGGMTIAFALVSSL